MATYINAHEQRKQENKKKKQNGYNSSSENVNIHEQRRKANQISALLGNPTSSEEFNERAKTLAETINSRMQSFTEQYNSFFNDYHDSNAVYNTTKQLKREAGMLNEMLSKYGAIFDDNYVSETSKWLNSMQNSIDKGAEHWLQWKTRDDYDTTLRLNGYFTKYQDMAVEDESKAIEDLQLRYTEASAAGNEKEANLIQEELGYLTVNSKRSTQGWDKYNADEEAEKKAEEDKKEEESFGEKILRYISGSSGGGIVDTTLPMANTTQTVNDLKADDSYKKPTDEWTEGQKKVFGYLYASSPDEAYKYAEELNNTINAEKEGKAIEDVKNSATSSFWAGVGHSVGAIATAPFGLADYLGDLAMGNAGRPITSDGFVSPFEYSQAVKGGISENLNAMGGTIDEDIPILGGKGWGDVYGLGMSTAQSMTSAFTLGGAGTLVSYFGQGAAAAVDDAKSRGATDEQAVLFGLASGTAEAAFELLPVENLLKPKNPDAIRNVVKEIFKQAGTEGIEEIGTETVNFIADTIIMGSNSNLSLAVKAYEDAGLSPEEALKKALLDKVSDIAWAGISGMASGSTSASIVTNAQAAKNISAGKDIKKQGDTEAMIMAGVDASQGSQAYGLAEKAFKDYTEGDALYRFAQKVTGADSKVTQALSKKHGKGNVSNMRLGALKQTTMEDVVDQYRNRETLSESDIQAKLESRGIDSKKAAEFASVVAKVANGKKLSERESAILNDNIDVKDVAEEVSSGQVVDNIAANIKLNKIDSLGKEKVAETPDTYSVSEAEGKTLLKDSGAEVNIVDITSIDNGNMMLKVNDGTEVKEVNAENISFASTEEAVMYEMVARMDIDAASAKAIIGNFDAKSGITAGQYILGAQEAFTYGKYNFAPEEMSKIGFSADLTQAQKTFAYNLGKNMHITNVDAQESAVKKAVDEAKTDNKVQGGKKGNVIYESGKTALTDRQEASVKSLEVIAKALGINIYLYESTLDDKGRRAYIDKDGKRITANGYYDPKTGDIHIDINAGENGEGVMLFTAAHELTHFVRQWSPAKFKVLADFLMVEYGKAGVPVAELVRYQQNLASKQGRKISYDTAYEEMIADSMQTMLSDGAVVEKLAKLANKDKSLVEKMKEKLDELVKAIKREYAKMTPYSKAGRYAAMLKEGERLQELFYDALVSAGENYRGAGGKMHPVYDGKKRVGYATLKPKFSDSPYGTDFSKHKNYYKLLEDFNMYDNNTEAVALQGAVKMVLPSEANRLNAEQMEAYKQALRDTGLFSEAEISKYAKKADMTFEEIIKAEMDNRQAYEEETDPKWDTTVKKVEDHLKKHHPRNGQAKSAEDYKNAKGDSAISRIKAVDGSYAIQIAPNEMKLSARNYSYDELVSKPDMKGITIEKSQQVKLSADGSIDASFIVSEVYDRCKKIQTKGASPTYFINVPDIDRNVEITSKGITHGFFASTRKGAKPSPRDLINARVSFALPEILANSIEVNQSYRAGNMDVPYSHVMMGTVGLEDAKGNIEYYAVRSVIEERVNQNPILVEAKILGKLYAVNAKKIGSPNLKVAKKSVARRYDETYAYSIADLLNDVKDIFDDTFSEDVYNHFSMQRKNNDFSKNLLYSERNLAPTFYSKMGRVVEDVKQEKLGASSVIPMLTGKGVKAEEIRWSGIHTFLDGKKSVTKQELLDFINGSMLEIGEQMSGGDLYSVDGDSYTEAEFKEWAYEIAEDDGYERDEVSFENFGEGIVAYVGRHTEENEILSAEKEEGASRWSQYKLDGGSNYRELVFTLPNSSYSNQMMRTHWGEDAEGVLVHARIQDFDVNGKKMLFIEEIQSDYHNEGHQSGYNDIKTDAQVDKLKSIADERFFAVEDYSAEMTGNAGEWETIEKTEKGAKLLREYREAQDTYDSAMNEYVKRIPDAPFKDNYHEFVLKRLLRMAAEQGYDSIGWTPADIQSKRWSDEYAEGYRIEYDQDMPKFLNKYGRQWGAKVERTSIAKTSVDEKERILKENELENVKRDIERAKRELARHYDSYEKAVIQRSIESMEKTVATLEQELSTSLSVWSMDITDSMRDSVLYEGQVLYSERVTDKKTLNFLENQEHITTYKSFVEIDGKLYSPMAAKVKGDDGKYHLTNPSELGVWQQSVEDPKNITKFNKKGVGYYVLKKDNGKGVVAAYNPYEHSSNLVLNDQFEEAYQRPNLVTVECIIPKSEMTSGYHAKYAKDSTGFLPWKSGTVAGKLKNNSRKVYLSRWLKPVRILSEAETASMYKDILGTEISVPFNVVPPALLTELEKAGVSIDYDGSPMYKSIQERTKNDGGIKFSERDPNATSNRSLLANALEDAVQNDIEKNKLKQYKEKIDFINAEERKLADLNRQLKELRFSKGKRDTIKAKKIRDLQDEATKTANRISIYDKQLLNLEASKPLRDILEREKVKAAKRQKQRDAEILQEQKDKANATIREIMNRNTESRKRAVEGRHKTVVRNKIKRAIKDLNSVFNRGTKERNVKIGLRDTVRKALEASEVLFSDEITNEDIVRLGVDSVSAEDQAKLERYSELLLGIEAAQKKSAELAQSQDFKKDSMFAKDIAYKINENNKRIVSMKNQISKLNKELESVFIRERARLNRENVSSALDSLAEAYASLQNSDDDYIKNNAFVQGMHDRIKSLSENLNGVTIKDMSLEQLEEVYKMYSSVKHMIVNANSIFRDGLREDLSKKIMTVQGEILELQKDNRKDPRVIVDAINNAIKSFDWNNQKPVYAFEKLGSQAFQELFWDAVKAEGVYAQDVVEAGEYLDVQKDKFKYTDWDFKKAKTFKSANGLDFKLTLADMMSIYAYSKRPQAFDHMTQGGFTFDRGSVYVDEKGRKRKHVRLSETYTVSIELINEIVKTLSEEQIGYVDAVQAYLTSLGEKGNEISRTLYGIDLFTEKVYFPLKSDADYRSSVEQALNETQTMVALKNTGMTKQTVPHANNPIVLQGFDDVALGHIDNMSKYHSFVLPIENLRRVFDNVSRDENASYDATKVIIESVFGESAKQYFDQYITDLNGGVHIGGYQNFMMDMFSKMKKTAVSASLSVVVQQPFAVIRAMDQINPVYFAPVNFNAAKKTDAKSQWEELKKYAPVAIIKEMGGFDVGSSRTTRDYIGGANYKGWGKVKGFFKDSDYRSQSLDNIFMWGASKADEIGWSTIWKAVKREVASQHKELAVGSEEFLQKCGERFTEVIVYTQVYDSVNSRSGMMRSKRDLDKFATSFMGEPTTTINMVENRMLKLARAVKSKKGVAKASAAMGRTIGVTLGSILLTSLAKSLVYAGRDDDEEDKALLERWAKSFGDSLTNDLNPLTMIPYLRDFVSIWEGWDVERPDMTVVADIVTSIKKAIDEGCDLEEAIALIGNAGNAFGLPVKNIIREVQGAINVFNDITDDIEPTDIGGAFKEGWTGEDKSKKDSLYQALANGDESRIAIIKAKYKTEEAYESAFKSAIRENNPTLKQAVIDMFNGKFTNKESAVSKLATEFDIDTKLASDIINSEYSYFTNKLEKAAEAMASGDKKAHDDIVRELRERYRGIYSQDEIIKAIKEVDLEKDKDTEDDKDEESSVYNTWMIKEAFDNGDNDTAYKMINDIVAVKTENYINDGYKKKEAESKAKSSIKSSITSYWKPIFLEAYTNKDSAEQKRIRQILLSSGLYGRTSEVIDTTQQWIKDSKKTK